MTSQPALLLPTFVIRLAEGPKPVLFHLVPGRSGRSRSTGSLIGQVLEYAAPISLTVLAMARS